MIKKEKEGTIKRIKRGVLLVQGTEIGRKKIRRGAEAAVVVAPLSQDHLLAAGVQVNL